MKYIMAYDIADPRRLRRVARYFEKHAIRCQKSVFVGDFTEPQLTAVLDGVADLISLEEDLVQAWRLTADQPSRRLVRGTAVPLQPTCVVHAHGHTSYVEEPES